MTKPFGYWGLVLGACLVFGIWCLGISRRLSDAHSAATGRVGGAAAADHGGAATVWRHISDKPTVSEESQSTTASAPAEQAAGAFARPQKETVPPPPPTDQASCEARGGTWGRFGLRQVPLCNLPAKDADKECADGSQCESHACIADETVTASQPTTGRCYGWTTTLGTCLDRVFNGQASGVICED